MSEEKPTQEEVHDRMVIALHGLELLAGGSCQAFNASGGHSGDPSAKVLNLLKADGTPKDQPLHLAYRLRWQCAHSQASKLTILLEAEAELKAFRVRQAAIPEKSISEAQVVLEDFVGDPPEWVAQVRKLTPTMVRQIRLKAGKGSEDGRPVLVAAVVDKPAEARRMAARKISTRTIADQLGVSQSAVMKWIRQTAA